MTHITHSKKVVARLGYFLNKFHPESETGQNAAFALLRMNEWLGENSGMEQALKFALTKKKNHRDYIRVALFRLSKLRDEAGIRLLEALLMSEVPEFPEECKDLALLYLIQLGKLDLQKENIEEEILRKYPFCSSRTRAILDHVISKGYNRGNLIPFMILRHFRTDEDIRSMGHWVHKLKAKDTTGKDAYYFVLVEPELEDLFTRDINGDGKMDLEDYGIVLASCYGIMPDEKTRLYLKEKYGFDV